MNKNQRLSRKVLASFGRKGHTGYVRVVELPIRGAVRAVVQWRDENERRQQESFARTRAGVAEAIRFAETMHDELRAPGRPTVEPEAPRAALTIRQLYQKYLDANGGEWRPKTFRSYEERWGKFELHADRDTLADAITRETLDAFKARLMTAEHSVNQVKQYIQTVVRVFRFGVERDVIEPTKVTNYVVRFGRDAARQRATMAEFSASDRDRILAQLDPRSAKQWRCWAATVIAGYCGPRISAVLALTMDDIDFKGDRIRWRPETDKMAHGRWQPMPAPVRDALWVAYGWRCTEEYTGVYVFFGAQRRTRAQALKRDPHRAKTREAMEGVPVAEKPYTYSAYLGALHAAEKRAGITAIKYRGAHGFRRGVAGDVFDLTGSEKAAAEYIGDKSTKIVRDVYLLEREERVRAIADKMGGGDD